MPGEHGDHIGDDEGGGRPGHQEEGDESHSLQEPQHRAFGSALPSAGRDTGLFLAAGEAGGGGRHVLARQAASTAPTATSCGTEGSATAGAGPARERGEARRPEEAAEGKAAGRGGWGPDGPGLLRNE